MRHLLPPAFLLGTQSISAPPGGCNPALALPGLAATTDAKASRSEVKGTPEGVTRATVKALAWRERSVIAHAHLSATAINDPPILDIELAATGERLAMEIIARRQDDKYEYIVESIGQTANRAVALRRAQCLAEMLVSIREYRVASAPFRPFWRRIALHNIAHFKRCYAVPERQAFQAAVARSKQRRAA